LTCAYFSNGLVQTPKNIRFLIVDFFLEKRKAAAEPQIFGRCLVDQIFRQLQQIHECDRMKVLYRQLFCIEKTTVNI